MKVQELSASKKPKGKKKRKDDLSSVQPDPSVLQGLFVLFSLFSMHVPLPSQ
jgi:hypothetical protein